MGILLYFECPDTNPERMKRSLHHDRLLQYHIESKAYQGFIHGSPKMRQVLRGLKNRKGYTCSAFLTTLPAAYGQHTRVAYSHTVAAEDGGEGRSDHARTADMKIIPINLQC